MAIKIEQSKDGTYKVRVWAKSLDVFGKRRTAQQSKIKTYSSAKKLAQELEAKLSEEEYEKVLTFGELEKKYFENRSAKMSPTTIGGGKASRERILNFWANIPVDKINTKIAQEYVDFMLKSKKENGDSYRNNTIKKDMHHINAVINWGVGRDYVEYNKVKRLDYPEEDIFEPTLLSAEKIGEVLAYLKRYCYNIYIPVLLYVTTGERRGEGLGLKNDNVDMDNSIFKIRNNALMVHGKLIEREKLKSKSSKRNIAISDFVKKELEEHIKMNEGLDDDHICATIFLGRAPYPDYVSKKFKKVMKEVFNIDIRLHDLRHSFNQLAYENDIDLTTRSKMLGHASEEITNEIYSHFSASQSKKAVNIISNKITASFGSV